MSEDGMDDWAAAMAEQAESEAEQEAGDNEDVQVAELDELTDDAPITQEEKKKQYYSRYSCDYFDGSRS